METRRVKAKGGRGRIAMTAAMGRGEPTAERGWMDANLDVQGYCLTAEESRALRWGIRFPTALCLGLAVTALALQSAVLIFALVPIGTVAGWTRRHPFDRIWNRGLRHLSGAPELPPNPTRRRHAFKLATVWLLTVGLLFALGQATAALILGGIMLAVCGLLTTTNFCVPSMLLSIWERRRPALASTGATRT